LKQSLGLALALTLAFPGALPAYAASCKTLRGEWVGFGEKDTRKEAEARLDQAITEWGQHYNLTAVKAKGRKVSCGVYIEFLNEYLCTADATVCR
jgi:hypothetical protein